MKVKLLFMVVMFFIILGITSCCPPLEPELESEIEEPEENLYSDWAGSAGCAKCHHDKYDTWIQSGHAYGLTKVSNGEKPEIYPYTALPDIPDPEGMKDGDNSLGAPGSYSDVSYIIGGYKWKALFTDLNGYLISGSDTQYNFETGKWADYHNNEIDKIFDCGKCHTSGWIPFSENGTRQESLPGIDGIFFAGGVHCEECHGPSAAHVADEGSTNSTKIDRSAELCGKCHSHDPENRIAVENGYVKQYSQYDELLGKDPINLTPRGEHLKAGVGCIQCHDPHSSVVHNEKAPGEGVIKNCIDCHSDRDIKPSKWGRTHADLECTFCHMPKLTKSAVGHDGKGTQYKFGDIRSHIFKIDLNKKDNQQFTEDGKFSYPWLTGRVVCTQCHNGVVTFRFIVPFGPGYTFKVHN